MRIGREIYWILLLLVGLTVLLSPCSMLAQAEKTDLTLTIVPDGYYNVINAGEEKTIFLEVGNGSRTTLENIWLSVDAPKDVTVEFNPAVIDRLPPGNVQTVDVALKIASNAAKGEHNITVIAQANEMRRVTSFYVRVESTSLFWVWVGAGIAAVLIAGFVVIFMRFGRDKTEEE
jgi:uncharacterized membrane protein